MRFTRFTVGLAAMLCAASVWAQAPILIKFSHVVAPDTPKGKAAEYFKKLAEERTHGRVKVDVYPNSTLYKDKEEMEALQLGAVQILAPLSSKVTSMGIKDFQVFDLPYIFDNLDEAHKITQGPVGKSMLNKLDKLGIAGLAFWDNAFKEVTANRPLRTPADFKGLKMRITPSKVIDAQMRALGANPQVLAFSEVYTALQTGTVDGEENPTSNIATQKFYEVQKYMTMTNHSFHNYVLVANKRFWDSLPPDIRKTMDGVVKDSTAYFNSIAEKDNNDALAELKKTKMQIVELTPAEKKSFKKALAPLHKQFEPVIGKELIDAIHHETNWDPSTF
ncbi:MAG TPA: TRAP transporter substrate-binding protein [Noviherbaspirillum sp.]|uniref:TRAP transporter substrate-binding protein n=1 Tax=Noviherbaspirillum sp. TaxID=1926288 RepID=UPI002B47A250|nr:TRAP transporter substrate-binding protein [Noviherbaspirillum sp.]HJV84110.1 TRAP transporter substrate-binding protein [Noviherbaspirillum sp.]